MAAIIVACVGMLGTVVVAVVFFVHWQTPLIKASGRELSLLLLAGIFLSYAATIVFTARPTRGGCARTRFFTGFSYTVGYAAILVRTNRIARIFNATHAAAKRTRCTSPRSQLVISSIIIGVYLLICAIWLVMEPPAVTHVPYPTRADHLLICRGADGASYLVGFTYPFLLIILCTVFAFKTRKCPSGFNETRYIAFTNYTTCVVWLAFMPMYFANPSNSIRVVTLCFGATMSATVALFCLFLTKLYVVLLRPEKNTKESVMSVRRTGSSYAGSNPNLFGLEPHQLPSRNNTGDGTAVCVCGKLRASLPSLQPLTPEPSFRRIKSEIYAPKVTFTIADSDICSSNGNILNLCKEVTSLDDSTESDGIGFNTTKLTELDLSDSVQF
ncbi:PREDICTED: metabotropic glutamate receptor 2-like [Priapulus caudatus]|uniref:Metabotropic glutamate receptor 2-like n=1 Tax=Priapulus caudatus TaxID=37621 RepID=A0ABM1FBN2_PRICU|nr:PREDICTED: metabotropic glutamate receptor 2-like [Priapulus caudatus]